MKQSFFEENEEFSHPLTDYFDDSWIGKRTRQRVRRQPITCQ